MKSGGGGVIGQGSVEGEGGPKNVIRGNQKTQVGN